MNWQEIAGSLVNALRNAGVKKDVIDLQEKHLSLLTNEIAVLARKLEVSEAERANLESKVKDLEKELESLRPKGDRLDETSEKILQLFAKHEELSFRKIARAFGLSKIVAEHHKDILWHAKMIQFFGEDEETGEAAWGLIEKGRTYLVEHGLVK